MTSVTYYSTPLELETAAAQTITPTDVVLDIGCGIRPMTTFQPQVHICLEPFESYVELMQRRFRSQPSMVILKLPALEGIRSLPDKSVDSVFLLDVIEHMTKDYGQDVLHECERVARKQIVISTPLGYMPQDYEPGEIDGWGVAYNPLQEHLSGWNMADFPEPWHLLICRHYHTTDSKGAPLAEPHGVMYAFRDFAAEKPALHSSPLLIGRTLPPAPLPSGPRTVILDLFQPFDQSRMGVASAYDARPYSPLYNIPDLRAFSQQRLNSQYHAIQWPDKWAELAARPPHFDDLTMVQRRFVEGWMTVCQQHQYKSLVLFDFAVEELLLAFYLAERLSLPVIVVEDKDYRVPFEAARLLPKETKRLDLQHGVADVRAGLLTA
jgi:hypothetical protein